MSGCGIALWEVRELKVRNPGQMYHVTVESSHCPSEYFRSVITQAAGNLVSMSMCLLVDAGIDAIG